MSAPLARRLAHVRWIGGGTDAGKTSVARALSARLRWPVYHYDGAQARHLARLAETCSLHAADLAESMDARWVWPEPDFLTDRTWDRFRDRFPLAVEDLTALSFPHGMQVLAEGSGLVPELVAPLLEATHHALWLLPTPGFKQAAMQARGKGRFGGEVSDPARAALNLLERDRQLAERVRGQAQALGMSVIEIDGTEDVDALARRMAAHFLGAAPSGTG